MNPFHETILSGAYENRANSFFAVHRMIRKQIGHKPYAVDAQSIAGRDDHADTHAQQK